MSAADPVRSSWRIPWQHAPGVGGAGRVMRAIVVREFGGPEVLVPSDVDEPSVLAHTAIVDVELASITFVETQLRAGLPPHPSMLPSLPWIPGNGVGGVVTSFGDGVDPSWLGARVISTTGG